jgi:biopolymer transport protein ExbD
MKINLPSSDDVQINIIPLIDVIFCILTFFLLASLQFTRQEAINLDLPKAETGTTDTTTNNKASVNTPGGRQVLAFNIDAIGQNYIDGRPIQRQQISEAFKSYIQKNPNAVLGLKANNTATYNDIIQIVDLWRQLGGRSVAFVTQPGGSSPTTSTPAPVAPTMPMSSDEPINPEMLPDGVGVPSAPNIVSPVPPTSPVPGIGNPQINPNIVLPAPITPIPGQPPTGSGIIPANPAPVPGQAPTRGNITSPSNPGTEPTVPKAPASRNQ